MSGWYIGPRPLGLYKSSVVIVDSVISVLYGDPYNSPNLLKIKIIQDIFLSGNHNITSTTTSNNHSSNFTLSAFDSYFLFSDKIKRQL